MGEDEIVALRRVRAERLVLFRRRPGLDVTDGETERIVDALESGIGARVPGRIGDAAGVMRPTRIPVGRACAEQPTRDSNATS